MNTEELEQSAQLETSLRPHTKAGRHALIVRILTSDYIHSQAQLRSALQEYGVDTTQATLSRDLVELRAAKMRSASGEQVYTVPEAGAPGQVSTLEISEEANLEERITSRLSRWCADLLVDADYIDSQLLLHTPAGAAQLLASAVDDAMLPGVLGCIAGDDTVLVITRDEAASAAVCTQLLSLTRSEQRR